MKLLGRKKEEKKERGGREMNQKILYWLLEGLSLPPKLYSHFWYTLCTVYNMTFLREIYTESINCLQVNCWEIKFLIFRRIHYCLYWITFLMSYLRDINVLINKMNCLRYWTIISQNYSFKITKPSFSLSPLNKLCPFMKAAFFYHFFGGWLNFLENACVELSPDYNEYVLLVDIYASETNKIKSHWTWNGIY